MLAPCNGCLSSVEAVQADMIVDRYPPAYYIWTPLCFFFLPLTRAYKFTLTMFWKVPAAAGGNDQFFQRVVGLGFKF